MSQEVLLKLALKADTALKTGLLAVFNVPLNNDHGTYDWSGLTNAKAIQLSGRRTSQYSANL